MMDTSCYEPFHRLVELHKLLGDERSKRLFWARLQYDTEQGLDELIRLVDASGLLDEETRAERMSWRRRFDEIARSGGMVCFWGLGSVGTVIAEALECSGFETYVFCDTRKSGVYKGKQIITPAELFRNSGKYYVIVSATGTACREIIQLLRENHFPEGHVLDAFNVPIRSKRYEPDYCELLPDELSTGAFVDAGCYDGADSIRFAAVSGGRYSKIYAFEPDPQNIEKCRRNFREHGVERVELFQAGLGEKTGRATLASNGTETSCYADNELSMHSFVANPSGAKEIEVQTVALDDAVEDPIGMIKMDIEGMELDALCGAGNTIKRDKPFLAVSIYHRQGDMLAIMQFLHDLVPEYRFWIRHYTPTIYDTVLFASVEALHCAE